MAVPTTTLKLDEAPHARVRRLAAARRRSAHGLMKEAITVYLDREEAREAENQAAVAALARYQETGLHATADEVRAWVGSWFTANDLPMPELHK